MQFNQERLQLELKLEQERLQLEMRGQQQEVEKRLEVEKVLEVEKMKCEVEHARLRLMGEGKFSPGEDGGARLASGSGDIISYLRLVPKFNERDPDIFFTLFEHIAEARNWSDSDRVLLLQCVLTGRAQEAYSAICGENTLDYDRVKSAVLKSYELVPEAYRQRFRSGVKGDKQTHVEFIRDLTSHFQRWCAAAKVASFDGLCELIVLEQFKNILPQRVATYVNEQKPPTAFRAAELADDFVLTHKGSFVEKYSRGDWKRGEDNGDARAKFSPGSSRRFAGTGRPEGAKVDQCHYCKGGGHWKEQCPLLETKGKPRLSPHAPAMCCSAVLVKKPQGVGSGMVSDKKLVCADLDVGSVFGPFITEAVVSIVGSDKYVPIKVLRDTAARYSFIVESVLPFSSETETGDFVLMRGMEMGLIPVRRHTVVLDCELVRGVVSIGVRPALPLDGVQMILGNDLAGCVVWAGVPPPVVVSRPLASVEPDKSGLQFPSVSPFYTITRVQSRRMSTDLPVSESGKSGPTRSFDFQIETKVKEKKERKRRKAKKRRPKEVSAPMSAYMLWLNASQPKEEWDIKAVESKKQYEIARQELEDRGGGGASSSPKI
ncbi:uncharacterized protein LOC117550381 isoform X2 [Gymnodraco acuticeps]|uniref:Uncharacterized protein LOC117550381 isoform X2 n=1 Tax=Gymnodraco acuticeps TaxID=8218 RepID=A0A6P8VRQ4_GYMAC|nr:uncharacterized protein LOC117550381 isoform X2 [Gymnodraco acuticeps]